MTKHLIVTHPIDESSIPCCSNTTFCESRLKLDASYLNLRNTTVEKYINMQ